VRNARAVRLARQALDVGGHGVLLVDARGRIAWQSPRARTWLSEAFGAATDALQLQWLEGGGSRRELADGRILLARRLGLVGLGESMWLLSVQTAGETGSSRLATASLTPREAEVLSWVAKGKTNRDVGDILGLSPRTVNKHLEHVFEKLGVETRAAAAALASREWRP
jgi:DNA-binding CsgD family transcriptional regulator